MERVNGVEDGIADGSGEPFSTKIFNFVIDECPFLPYTVQKNIGRPILNGEGCDGLDND